MANFDLPYNTEAEKSVLGSMMVSSAAASMGTSSLIDENFYDRKNRLIFQAMNELHKRNKTIDAQTVADELINLKTLEDAGGREYIWELVDSVISEDEIDHYINIVRDLTVFRKFLRKIDDIKTEYAEEKIPDIGEFISGNLDSLQIIANERTVGGFKSVSTVVDQVRNQLSNEANFSKGNVTGINTGYSDLDKYTHGWQKGDLIILAARPSVGKTAFALNLILNAAKLDKKPVAFFSCEMAADQIMKRILSCEAMVNADAIQTGRLSRKDFGNIDVAVQNIKQMKVYIDDTPSPYLGDVIAKAHKLKATEPELSLIVLDYIGLVKVESGSGRNNMSRSEEVGRISGGLKELARQLRVPVIALSQLNRNVDDNPNMKPQMSNLRESGAIEQDADICILMYRADYQKTKKKGDEKPPMEGSVQEALLNDIESKKAEMVKNGNEVSITSFNIAKNRNGKIGEIQLMFERNYCRFTMMDHNAQNEARRSNGADISEFDGDDE
ncbi:MAG: replicative DNA helicase [Bacilli bacterium]|nr:replicative DNA helicase [Bacilli bacterium]